jgi:putative ABC transport system ATP-binding protein
VRPGAAVREGVDVHCENVVHLYPMPDGDVVALRGVDLDVAAGEMVALLGPSGAGKSTLLALLAGLMRPSAGEVHVGEHVVSRLPPAELSRLRATVIALVPQDADKGLLLYATPEQNIWFAQHAARSRGRASRWTGAELLSALGLEPLAGRPCRVLSPGDQKRVALAAAAAASPRLLLVDEPTSQLDSAARDETVGLLARLRDLAGVTVVLVTHDPHVAAVTPRTVTIRDGRVGAEGREGTEYAIVGRDGTLQIPREFSDLLPPGALVRLHRREGLLELRPAGSEAPAGPEGPARPGPAAPDGPAVPAGPEGPAA